MKFTINISFTVLCMLLLFTTSLNAATTTQSTGLVSGDDSAPTQASITVNAGTCVQTINSITISTIGSSYGSTFCQTNGTGDWYGFDLYIDGALVLNDVCETEIEAYSVPTTASTIMIESQDDDSANDVVNMEFEINIDYTIAAPVATFTQICNSDLTYTLEVNISSLGGATSVKITDGTTDLATGISATGTYSYTSLSAAATYAVVNEANTGCIVDEAISVCDICSVAGQPSDDCSTATPLDLSQPFSGSTDCGYTAVVEDASTTSGCFGCGVVNNNSWFKFTAAASDVEVDWEITGGSSCTGSPVDTGIQLGVFEGSCGSLCQVGGFDANCENPTGGIGSLGTFTMSGLTVGTEYYLQIDGYAGDLCDYNIIPAEGVAITPPNDDCANATTLTCGGTAITGDNVLASDTDAPNSCPSGGSEQDGVWFTFTGNGSDYIINTTGSDFETDLNVYTTSGTPANYCNNLTCIDAYTGSAQEATLTVSTVNGTVYYVYLDGKSGAQGSFSIAMTCTTPPACDAEAGTWN